MTDIVGSKMCNKDLGFVQPMSGGPPAWVLGKGLTTSHRKKPTCYEMSHRASQ